MSESQRIARLGHWEFDHVNNQLTWSDEIYSIFAFDREETPSYEIFMDFVHSEDRGHVERAYTDSLESKHPYNIIHRIVLKDGSTRFVHQISETMYDENGQPVRTIGTVQEVTNRIIADEKLWQGELWNKHKNGNLYAERLTVTAIKDKYGEISRYVGAAQDITDRKQTVAYTQHLADHDE